MSDSNSLKRTLITNQTELIESLNQIIPSHLNRQDVFFFCIGTDRCTGDSLGPLVGSFLEESGFSNVSGTLTDPIHAQNSDEKTREIPLQKIVIAIDSALGRAKEIETFTVLKGKVKPGLGVKKELPEVGDYSIMGIVNVVGFLETMVLANTRLSIVMKMARSLSNALIQRFSN